jgi:hypothetical protein
MAAGRLIFPGLMPAADGNDDRLPGAKAYFYANGSTTLADTFTDATLTVKNTNPVVADGLGIWPQMWADIASVFVVAITDSAGVPIPSGTWSGVSASFDAALASAVLAESAREAAEEARDAARAAEAAAEAAEAQAQAYAAAMVRRALQRRRARPTSPSARDQDLGLGPRRPAVP